MLEGERPAGLVGSSDRLPHELALLWVHVLEERLVGIFELFWRPTEDTVKLIGPGNGVRFHVPLPASDVGYALRLGQPGFALTQGFFCLLASGYVPSDGLVLHEAPPLIEESPV